MHYYQHHLGDYAKDTGHLSLAEHGAYRMLMDHYYSTEAPLPADECALFRICRAVSTVERSAVRSIASRFFKLTSGTLTHKRVDREIGEYQRLRDKNAANGKRGGRPRNPNETQTKPNGLFLGSVSVIKTETQTKAIHDPVSINQKNIPKPLLDADPRHHEITSAWKATYLEAAGEEGPYDGGKEGKALQKFLTGWNGTADEFLTTASRAIKAGRANAYKKHCRVATTISGLCKNWTEVKSELALDNGNNLRPHRPATVVTRNTAELPADRPSLDATAAQPDADDLQDGPGFSLEEHETGGSDHAP